MFEYTVDKSMSQTAVKADAKAKLTAVIMQALVAEFGADNVSMVRTVTPSGTGKNVLAVRMGTVNEDGVFDLVATVDPATKEWVDRMSSKSGELWRNGFDFESARAEYESWQADKAAKDAAKAAKAAQGKAGK